MRWIAPTEKDTATVTLEKRSWDDADQFSASSGLKPQEYSSSTLGRFFLRLAERVRRRHPHGYELYPECVCP